MKTNLTCVIFALCVAMTPTVSFAQDSLTPQQLTERSIERRAVEAAIWAMPVVNYDLMLQQMLSQTPAKVNEVVYWSKPLDWHNQTLTPNPDAIYFMAFFNTKDAGPIVLEVPPAEGGSMNANIVNIWQMPLEDAGLLGVDKGKGIKFLIVPPGYSEPIPAGYTVLQPGTFGSYALLRSNLASHSDSDVAKSVEYGKRIKVYPLAKAADQPATTFTDASAVLFDSTIRYNRSFFEGLNRIVQAEPWLDRDRAMIDPLKTLGIEKASRSSQTPHNDQSTGGRHKGSPGSARGHLRQGIASVLRWHPLDVSCSDGFDQRGAAGFTDPNAYSIDQRGSPTATRISGLNALAPVSSI
jgi:hypothetical protein